MLWFGTVVIRVALAFGFSCSIIGGGIGSMALVEGTLLLASVLDAGEVFVGGAWSALEAVVGLGAAATALSLGGVLILASGHANAPPTGPLRNVGATHCGATHLRSEVQLIWTVVRSLIIHHPPHFSPSSPSHHHRPTLLKPRSLASPSSSSWPHRHICVRAETPSMRPVLKCTNKYLSIYLSNFKIVESALCEILYFPATVFSFSPFVTSRIIFALMSSDRTFLLHRAPLIVPRRTQYSRHETIFVVVDTQEL
uniref:Putative tick transposon n=1 Tax=Ixodes ricinus TaxID=34613 RepID=A0A6B0V5I8_IXORI